MKSKMSRPIGRFFYWPILIALIALWSAGSGMAATPVKTTVEDTVYRADGSVAQGTLLISWGKSQLSKTANNYFGIKQHGKHAAMEFRTNEVSNGSVKQVTARFAAYGSMDECFECRDQLIACGAVYGETRAAKGDLVRFAHELGKHWATDPKYADKLLRIYEENGFERFDQSVSK